jgi:hypothetical protein
VKHIRARHRRVARLVTMGLLGAALAIFGFIGTVGAGPAPPPEGPTTEEPATEQVPPECDPNYVPCVPPFPPDVDCPDIGHEVQVVGNDPHGLDADNDGTGCDGTGGAAASPPPAPMRAPARFTG